MLVAGRVVEIDRSSRAVFAKLLAGGGTSIDKDQLLEAGWPGRIVHENSLAKAIGRLRQALGDDGGALETVHGYGYRLTMDADAVALPPPRPRRLRRPAFLTAALGSTAAAAMWLGGAFDDTRRSRESALQRGEPADAAGRILWVDDHPENNVREKRFFEQRKIAVYQVTASEEVPPLLAMYE